MVAERPDGGRMATNRHIRSAGSVLLVAALLGLVVAARADQSGPSRATTATSTLDSDDLDGRDTRLPPTNRPTVQAAFARESYAPGQTARLVIWTSGRHVSYLQQ